MKKVPKWCIIGFFISLIVFIVTFNIYTKQNDKDKEEFKYTEEKAIILDKKEYGNYENGESTIATINMHGKEYKIDLGGHGYKIGEIVSVYKYKDNYYSTIDRITFTKVQLVFWLMSLSIFATFIFFPFQIIANALSKKNIV